METLLIVVIVICILVIAAIIVVLAIPKNNKYTSTPIIFGCDKSLPCCTINTVFDENPICNQCCYVKD